MLSRENRGERRESGMRRAIEDVLHRATVSVKMGGSWFCVVKEMIFPVHRVAEQISTVKIVRSQRVIHSRA